MFEQCVFNVLHANEQAFSLKYIPCSYFSFHFTCISFAAAFHIQWVACIVRAFCFIYFYDIRAMVF